MPPPAITPSPASASRAVTGAATVGPVASPAADKHEPKSDPYWAYGPLEIVPRLIAAPAPAETTIEDQAKWYGAMYSWARRVNETTVAHHRSSLPAP